MNARPVAMRPRPLDPRPPSTPRWRHRLADLPWAVFLVWTAVGAVVMPLRLDADRVAEALAAAPGLGAVMGRILRAGDAVWIVLAAVVVYLDTAAAEGPGRTRRWAAIILPGAAVAEWVGARTGFPFGPYAYTTDRFGWRLGGVLPFTIPLAWLIIVLGARALVGRVWPTAGRAGLALGVAVVGVMTDVNLEFIAWRERGYWAWYPGSAGALADVAAVAELRRLVRVAPAVRPRVVAGPRRVAATRAGNTVGGVASGAGPVGDERFVPPPPRRPVAAAALVSLSPDEAFFPRRPRPASPRPRAGRGGAGGLGPGAARGQEGLPKVGQRKEKAPEAALREPDKKPAPKPKPALAAGEWSASVEPEGRFSLPCWWRARR